jgi:hypothetical protein
MKSDKIKEFAVNVHFLSFKKGGKIQTGLNCEYDGLSEARLSLFYSNIRATSVDYQHKEYVL